MMTHRFVLHADLAASLSEASMAECRVVLHELGLIGAVQPVGIQFAEWLAPFHVVIAVAEGKLEITICSSDQVYCQMAIVPLSPMRPLIRDYEILCKSHAEAVASSNPYRLEAIDMGRRSIHNEGAEYIQNALQSSIEINHETARHLFTLVTLLYRRMGSVL